MGFRSTFLLFLLKCPLVEDYGLSVWVTIKMKKEYIRQLKVPCSVSHKKHIVGPIPGKVFQTGKKKKKEYLSTRFWQLGKSHIGASIRYFFFLMCRQILGHG